VEQTLTHFMRGSHNYMLFFALSMVPTLILAALSWHLVEKPALRLRKPLRAASSAAIERLGALARPQPRIEPGG
jgi:peptidoglycan/LPS O-acetylase OafA/YrhL